MSPSPISPRPSSPSPLRTSSRLAKGLSPAPLSPSGTDAGLQRLILIFCIWAVLGFFGLGLFLEGLKDDSWALAATGVGVIALAFAAHIIVNGVFDTGFSQGEAVLGIGTYGLLGLVFVVAAASGSLSMTDYYACLTLFAVLSVGFLAYLSTRHGLRGAFSRFHIRPLDQREDGL